MNSAKQIWEDHAANDAYFAVATYEDFQKGNLDAAAKERFFESGQSHVDLLWSEIERRFGLEFRPARALDYGCGVGRILVSLAEKCGEVTGVDISQSMLDETRRNCDERGLKNVELKNADDYLADSQSRYDFVHSYIVLQHVVPRLGEQIICQMVNALENNGIGMIHMTFRDQADAGTKLRARVYRDVPLVHSLLSAFRGKTARFMPMYEYDVGAILRILHENSCSETFVRITDHGFLGAMIFFQKNWVNPA